MRNRATNYGFLVNSVVKFTGFRVPVNGIYLAQFRVGASLSPSHAREISHEEAQARNGKVTEKLSGRDDAWHCFGGRLCPEAGKRPG